MNRKSCFGTPLSSKSRLNDSKSLFHDFVRPRSQLAAKFGSSPFKGSPQSESFDFIPLSYSSPVDVMNRGDSGKSKGSNRESFDGRRSNSSCNSSFSPCRMNRKYYHNNSASSNGSSSFSPFSNMERSRKYSSNRKRRVGTLKKLFTFESKVHAHVSVIKPLNEQKF
jgi:hypothetical protein